MGSLKKQIKTVRGKLFLTLCIVVASIIIFLILVNKFVLEKYYQYMKSNALKSVYNQINSYYNGDIQIDDINDALDKISVSNHFDIIIKNDQNIVVYLSNKAGSPLCRKLPLIIATVYVIFDKLLIEALIHSHP